ncbi:MAG: outer membrane protein assembly factor BamB family protein [Pirellulaceae bacterium]
MKMIAATVPLLLVFSTTLAHAESNWPQFRGPEGNGHAQATGLATVWSEQENIAWKTPLHGRGWSSPVIWANQIWLTTATEDGKQLFALCVDGDSGSILHDVHLFDVANPDEIHVTNSYASPTPVLEQDRVYVHFGTYGTACLDTSTGQVLWQRRDLRCNHWRGPGSSPILFADLLIMHFDGYDLQYVVALDKNTGETRWKTDRNIDYQTDDGDLKKAFCTPTIISVQGQLQLISPAAKATIAYDPRTGRELWRMRYDNHSATARPLFGHGLLFINSGFSKAELYAVRPGTEGDVTDTHVVWKTDRSIGSKPSHLLIDDLLYVVHDQGTASCLNALTGQSVWQKRLGGNFSASPLFADGKIYFFNEEGVTTVVRPGRTCEILATNHLDDGCMASPAVLGAAIVLRTKSHLYRIEGNR